ncbi:MAG: DNA/RNA nuclease SfsA [Candidatus Njordarchaeales archaeon]
MKKLLRLQTLVIGHLVKREKKFIAYVKRNNQMYKCFFPNPSRLENLLYPGQDVLFVERRTSKSDGRVVGIKYRGEWLIIDTDIIHKRIAHEIIRRRLISRLPDFVRVLQERRIDNYRVDYVLLNKERCIVEVKGCYRILGEKAYFPDAISERSTKQVYKLVELMRRYELKPYILFISPVPVKEIGISKEIDPDFYKAIIYGINNGIHLAGAAVKFDGATIYFIGEVNVVV